MSAQPSAPPADLRDAVERVKALLDKVMQVELSDGRLVEGHLECFDKLGNMILGDAYEVRDKNGSSRSRFALGLVLAPSSAIAAIRVRSLDTTTHGASATGQLKKLSLEDTP